MIKQWLKQKILKLPVLAVQEKLTVNVVERTNPALAVRERQPVSVALKVNKSILVRKGVLNI